MFVGIAVSMNLISAHEGYVLVMNSRMSLSLGNAFSRKPGSRARGGLKAGRPTDGRQAGRAQALEPGCEASRARQRCDESRESAAAKQHFWAEKLATRAPQSHAVQRSGFFAGGFLIFFAGLPRVSPLRTIER